MAAVTMKFNTQGMHCPSCPMLIEIVVSELNGVVDVTADLRTHVAEVTFDPAVMSEDGIVEAIESAGYGASAA